MTTDNLYFIQSGNGQKIGPIAVEQLAQEEITPRTLVWRQGLEDWKEARLLPELDFLWQNNTSYQGSDTPSLQTPPSLQPPTPQYNIPDTAPYANNGLLPKCPPSYLTLATIGRLLGVLFTIASCIMPAYNSPEACLILSALSLFSGTIAFVNANRVEKSYNQRNFTAAKRYSKFARAWSIASLIGLGLIILGFSIVLLFIEGLSLRNLMECGVFIR
nr:GYF domain-containing protein [uncultured Porphyromonas sp.]